MLRSDETAFFRSRGCVIIVIALLLIASVFPAADRTEAQGGGGAGSNTEPKTGLDILFLVDQSASMGGSAFGGDANLRPNDPLELRFEAVQYALATLGDYAQFLPDLTINMAVINFGDEPVVTLNWTLVGRAPDASLWQQIQQGLVNQLSADQFRTIHTPAHLGSTNFRATYEAARDLMQQAPAEPNSQYLRAIILLTDGQPCVTMGAYRFTCTSESGQQQHMDALLELTQTSFPPPDYRLYVLALDANGDLWDNRREDWERIVGDPHRAVRVESSQQVGSQFLLIMTELLDQLRGGGRNTTQLAPGQNTIAIPPYLSQARISIFKSNTLPADLQVSRPDGTTLSNSDPNLEIANQDRAIEVWTITSPQPGDWLLTLPTNVSGLDVFLELIPIEVQLDLPAATYRQFDEIDISIQLKDAQGQPLEVLPPPYALQMMAQINLPNGTMQELPLVVTGTGHYFAKLPALYAGDYIVSISANTQFPAGTTYSILKQVRVGLITVTGVSLRVNGLPQTDFLLSGQHIELTAYLEDAQGVRLLPNNLSLVASLQPTNANAGDVAAEMPLTVQAANSTFSAVIPLEQTGTFTLRVLAQMNLNGKLIEVGRSESSVFTILKSERISIHLLDSLQGAIHNATEALPPFEPQPLVLPFSTVLSESGDTIDVLSIVQDQQSPWTIEVHNADTTIPSSTLTTSLGADVGEYTVILSNLKPGKYTVTIRLNELTGLYVPDPVANAVTYSFTVVTHPGVYVFWGVVASVTMLALVLVGSYIRTRRRRAPHPARGKLDIVEIQGFNRRDALTIWKHNLNGYSSNFIHFGKRQLPKKRVGITELLIYCDSEEMSQSSQIRVVVKRGRKVVQEDILSPHGWLALTVDADLFSTKAPKIEGVSTNTYFLVKDKDDSVG